MRLFASRHCEPTGRANARLDVIASAAKQSILPLRGEMDCFAALAMTIRQILALRGEMDCLCARQELA